jgi:hypothetical protein
MRHDQKCNRQRHSHRDQPPALHVELDVSLSSALIHPLCVVMLRPTPPIHHVPDRHELPPEPLLDPLDRLGFNCLGRAKHTHLAGTLRISKTVSSRSYTSATSSNPRRALSQEAHRRLAGIDHRRISKSIGPHHLFARRLIQ